MHCVLLAFQLELFVHVTDLFFVHMLLGHKIIVQSYHNWQFIWVTFPDNFFFFLLFPMWVFLKLVRRAHMFPLFLPPAAMFVSYFNNLGSHVICAPLSGVLVGTISLFVVQPVGQVLVNTWSPYRLTCRSICWSTLNWYVGQYIGQHSTASPPTCQLICRPIHDQYTGRHSADTGSTNCRWNIGQLSVELCLTIGGLSVDCRIT